MNNPTYLQLCLNDFVISRSSIHEFETCKDYIFLRRKIRFKKKDGWKDNKNVYFKNIYWGVYMSCIQVDAILNSSSIPCFTYLYMRQV